MIRTSVDAVSRLDGRRRPISIGVPCPIERSDRAHVVGRFLDAGGRPIVRYGFDGRSFAKTMDGGGSFSRIYQAADGRLHGLTCAEILGHPPGGIADPKSVGNWGEAALDDAYDLGPAKERIEQLKARILQDFALAGIDLLISRPFPRWHVAQYGSQIALGASNGDDMPEHTFVGIGRRDAAAAAMRSFSRGRREPNWCGQVIEYDPVYDVVDDVALLARGVGRFFRKRLQPAVADLPASLVRALHDVSNWQRIDPTKDRELALAVIEGGFRLMEVFEADPRLSGRVVPHLDPSWLNLRNRLVEIEGFGPDGRPRNEVRPAP